MASRTPTLELDAFELSFTALITGAPLGEYEESLQAIRSDVCGGDQNDLRRSMLLLMAIRSGNVAWVERLLRMGADPSTAKDIAGLTAEEVALRMCEKHPGNEEVASVLNMIRRSISLPVTSTKRLEKLGREEILNGSTTQLKSKSDLVAPSNMSFLLQELRSLRGLLVNFKAEISSAEETQGLISVRKSVISIIKLLELFNCRSEEETIPGMKGDQRSLTTSANILDHSLCRITEQMAELKESMSSFRDEACVLKPLKTDLESTIKSLFQMTDSINVLMKEVKDIALERQKEHEAMLRMVNLHLDRRSRQTCVNDMMRKTMIIDCDGEKVTYVRRLFENLYLVDEVTYTLIKFVISVPDIKICIDCNCNTVEQIKKHLVNEDGVKLEGARIRGFADLNMNVVYLGAQQKDRSEENVIGCLALCLTQIVIHRVFHNKGLPYEIGQSELEKQFNAIANNFLKNKVNLPIGSFMREATLMSTWIGKCMRLIASVPADMALYKSTGGRAFVKDNAPELLCFFEKQVLEAIL
ncbi:uncharacterized protein LOC124158604 [Ischnura elegans]|uniref:uncharacterized protein LOC124158604 n=1 Tax=Ischnura elegans TaxID=197161 RepID=UPI001ED89DBF|nr:uncharacterized protein LOC124158604 [Ischnura elegans]XP_046389727.1 uncharacterized protein LOC124158604 [Ischnura elegans]